MEQQHNRPPMKQQKLTFGSSKPSLMSDSILDKKIQNFNPSQRLVYNHLKKLTIQYFQSRPESKDEIYNWNELNWHNIIINLTQQLWNSPSNESDCYMLNPQDSTGTLHVTPVEVHIPNCWDPKIVGSKQE